jgi:hypothetical protein
MTHAPLHSNLDFYTEIMAKTESRDIKCGGQRCYRLLLPKQSPEAVAFVAPVDIPGVRRCRRRSDSGR